MEFRAKNPVATAQGRNKRDIVLIQQYMWKIYVQDPVLSEVEDDNISKKRLINIC